MATGSILFALLAGILSTLSPCVLPLLPLVLGAAVSEHRFGPAAPAAGLALSFVAIGLFVATIGFSIGLDTGIFRSIAALLLLAVGLVLLVPKLQAQLAVAGGPVSGWADRRFSGFSASGLKGQFAVGLLLGAVWSPCVGPTLGAASVLAAQGKDLGQVAIVMIAFGIGATLPLLLLGLLSREVMIQAQPAPAGRSRRKGDIGGTACCDRIVNPQWSRQEPKTFLVDVSPGWLTRFTTQF